MKKAIDVRRLYKFISLINGVVVMVTKKRNYRAANSKKKTTRKVNFTIVV